MTKVQERIRKFYDQGYQIVIFGKKDHAEVIGLVGHVNNEAVVIKSVEEAATVDPSRKTVLFSQTTMDKATFYAIAEALRGRVRDFVVGTFEESAIDFHAKDTICGQVSGRDKKLREFSRSNDVMVFVAGRNSSNGKVLYEICRDANPRPILSKRNRSSGRSGSPGQARSASAARRRRRSGSWNTSAPRSNRSWNRVIT